MQLFKGIGFLIDIETNLKIVNFFDVTFNLKVVHSNPIKNQMIHGYIYKKNSNHQPQIIKQLPKIISDRLSKNSSNEEVFNESKGEYENALKQSGYNNINLKYQPLITSNTKQKRHRNKAPYGLIHHSAVMSPLMLPKSLCNC